MYTWIDGHTDIKTHRRADRWTEKHTDRQIKGQQNRYTNLHTDTWTDAQKDRKTGKQITRQTYRQTDVPAVTIICYPYGVMVYMTVYMEYIVLCEHCIFYMVYIV